MIACCAFAAGFVIGFVLAATLAMRAAAKLRASHRISCSDPVLAHRLHRAGINVEAA